MISIRWHLDGTLYACHTSLCSRCGDPSGRLPSHTQSPYVPTDQEGHSGLCNPTEKQSEASPPFVSACHTVSSLYSEYRTRAAKVGVSNRNRDKCILLGALPSTYPNAALSGISL